MPIPLLGADPASPFPPLRRALREPDGLLAAGGDLSPVRLLNAYRHGIFPWFSEGQPILWWSPDPRLVFDTAAFRLPARFRRQLRQSAWTLSADRDFDGVMAACASAPRPGQDGTWIGAHMLAAYRALHRLGHAHSIEVHAPDGRMVGGIYGVAIGRMFFGESMFSAQSGGSKAALAGLIQLLASWDWPLLDAQVENPHLLSLGATRLARVQFMARVEGLVELEGLVGSWSEAFGELPAAALAG
ncbi:MAG: leucyl/phenylalanyl-tRNA--protein transferase [Arenimonas sp.]